MVEAAEQEIGDQVAGQINAQLPLVRDPALSLYVNRLGRLIARHSDRPDLPYRFYIVNSPAVNAFAWVTCVWTTEQATTQLPDRGRTQADPER